MRIEPLAGSTHKPMYSLGSTRCLGLVVLVLVLMDRLAVHHHGVHMNGTRPGLSPVQRHVDESLKER